MIISSTAGCFRIKKHARYSFVRDLLPTLSDPLAEPDLEAYAELEGLGVLQRVPADLSPTVQSGVAQSIAVARPTSLAEAVVAQWWELGLSAAECDAPLVLVDHSGLDVSQSLRLLREIHARGRPSFSIWERDGETFLGPLTIPGESACWNCARLRIGDSVSSGPSPLIADQSALVNAVTENLLVAVNFSELAALGCVVVESSTGPGLHRLIPMPWCELCGGASAGTPAGLLPSTTSSLIPAELQLLADERTGIVRKLLIFQAAPGEDPIAPASCSATIAPYQDGIRRVPGSTGEGKGLSLEAAIWSAIGEGVERYSASVWDPAAITRAPFSAVVDAAFDPRWLCLYDEEQYATPDFRFARFDPEQPIAWATGHWLDSGESVLTPALATYMYFPVAANEQLCQSTSNGLAADVTFEGAALRALYELIERDAFMMHWLARRPARRIAEETCEVGVRQILREVHEFGARTELYVLDIGTQHPTVVCLGLGDGRTWPGTTIGLGTHADPEIAIQRAILEHSHCGAYIRRLMLDGQHESMRTPENVTTGVDHALYYVRADRAAALDSFRGSARRPLTVRELRSHYRQEATLDKCVARLCEAGIRTAIVDVTSPDVGLTPMRVARAFGRYMQPIHFGYSNRRLANPRLRRWMQLNGAQTEPHPIA